MARVATERAVEQTEQIVMALRGWYGERESDSVRVQKMRAFEVTRTSESLKSLVYDVQPQQRLVLTIGSLAAKASMFSKGAYDFYTETREVLDPEQRLVFERTDEWGCSDGRELYVGDYSVVIAVSKLAKTLHEGSQLAVVDHVE